MMNFIRRDEPHRLVVAMTGVELGERLAQIGCAHGGRLGAIAKKVGLSGHAAAFVPDEAAAARARNGAAQAGVLVEVEICAPGRLPADDASFDVVILDDTGGWFATMADRDRAAAIHEARRIVRPGGRILVIRTGPRTGLARLLSSGPDDPAFDATAALESVGFKSVRTLAERDGLSFVEGIRPRAVA
jgi:SAM-dependent methyltransferase